MADEISVLVCDRDREFGSLLSKRLEFRNVCSKSIAPHIGFIDDLKLLGPKALILDNDDDKSFMMLKKVKQSCPDLPVVVLLDPEELHLADIGLSNGAYDCVSKAVDMKSLMDILGGICKDRFVDKADSYYENDDLSFVQPLDILVSGNSGDQDLLNHINIRDYHIIKASLENLVSFSFEIDPDAIVLDFKDGMDSLKYIKKITKLKPFTKVIVISEDRSLYSAMEVLEQGAFDYLIKPVDHEELIARIYDGSRQRSIEKKRQRIKQRLITA